MRAMAWIMTIVGTGALFAGVFLLPYALAAGLNLIASGFLALNAALLCTLEQRRRDELAPPTRRRIR